MEQRHHSGVYKRTHRMLEPHQEPSQQQVLQGSRPHLPEPILPNPQGHQVMEQRHHSGVYKRTHRMLEPHQEPSQQQVLQGSHAHLPEPILPNHQDTRSWNRGITRESTREHTGCKNHTRSLASSRYSRAPVHTSPSPSSRTTRDTRSWNTGITRESTREHTGC